MIEVNNLTTVVIDEDFLKKTAKIVTDGEKKKAIELSIALVRQGRIRELNKRYRGKNRVTDVLSFSYDGSGDIVICLGEVKKNAKRFGTTFKKELAICLIHGILHLLGYDHEKEAKEVEETKASSSPFAAARVMEEKQNYYLKICQGVIS
ncbi:MAG: rRNA maturation RNase YbeY [Candidatus Nealsonbacteria bacterium CG18_big_fil_WC_8_21_14_2_50_37_10]|uniref:Endoribonuclease YbeY n=1 Tax=Candidatus Nealsonbacteria bacterium CG18_big_fil_WC_8_21_14_2_50_37_10 TaxID=1974717 RepID=A0A2H0FHU6_9BACT|nr:MAG: rRNA maturation RNase YbeY [Candidatus Nealsonbacteria bacterium CG18_big_fil_WC_8_21_14_2_50_37_10]